MDGWHACKSGLDATQRELCEQYVRAAGAGDVGEALRLIGEGVPVDSGTSGCCGHYPVIVDACRRGDVEMVAALLTVGANPNHQECSGAAFHPIFSCAHQHRFHAPPQHDGSCRTKAQNDAILRLLIHHVYASEFKQLRAASELTSREDLEARAWWQKGGQGQRFEDADRLAMLVDAGAGPFFSRAALVVACEDGDARTVRKELGRGLDTPTAQFALQKAAEFWEPEGEQGAPGGWLECMRLLLAHGAMVSNEEALEVLEACRTNVHIDVDWTDDLEQDQGLRTAPPAMLIRQARTCHPYRIARAKKHWRRVTPLVGRWRLFLLQIYVEVTFRPGHRGMASAAASFAAAVAATS